MKKMTGKDKVGAVVLVVTAAVLLAAMLLQGTNIAVLHPAGTIASRERSLLTFAALLALIVVLPVFVLTFFIVWRYREGNVKATYTPEWDHSRLLETIWWTVPLVLIIILSAVTWNATHALDPNKPLASSAQPLTIQVVALQWKWLFIYPEQNIATVNFIEFPVNTPVNFEITADAPMNSFWIPSLGGQIYAMSGMTTHLHLMASEAGSYRGSSANISGDGFAGMGFVVRAGSRSDFTSWVQSVKTVPHTLRLSSYNQLSQPSKNNQAVSYASAEVNLFEEIVTKFTPYGHIHGAET